jgi:phosphoribosyl-dephospho-CoA transferase
MLQRHDLVRLTDAGWQRMLASMLETNRSDADTWRHGGWPAVVRRSEPDAESGVVNLGLPLPPDENGHKRRLAFAVTSDDIATTQEPVRLRDAIDAAPLGWQAALRELEAACVAQQLVPQVFGSLAYQHLTGLDYLRSGSDIDVLIRPASTAQVTAAVELLAAFARRLPLDGELVFPDGRAVAWKEWRQSHSTSASPTRVLVKHARWVGLSLPSELLNCFTLLNKVTPC